MNPSEKGWLNQYIRFRKHSDIHSDCLQNIKKFKDTVSEDEFLYCLLQPTGLLYGYPVQFPRIKHPDTANWNEKEKMKVLLAESFMSCSIYYSNPNVENRKELQLHYEELIDKIASFYTEIFPEVSEKKKKSRFGRKRKQLAFTEAILNHRIEIKQSFGSNFWISFFQNSLLFLDIYYFSEWINPNNHISIEDIHQKHDDIRMLVLQVIAAAAHANNIIETEERNLFSFFLKSANLPPEKEREAAKYLDGDFKADDINVKSIQSWILKKYLLELAILTIWSDKQVEESEKQFITKFAGILGLDEQEINKSMLAVESFVLSNYQHVHYLQERQNYKIVSQRFARDLGHVLKFYKKGIIQEIRESKELIDLLNKSTRENLSPVEREKVRQQLIDILKALPLFAIIALPGRSLSLPILMKVLPKEVFPSSFQPKSFIDNIDTSSEKKE